MTHSFRTNFQALLNLRGVETFENNGYKQIQENERYNNHKTDKVHVRSQSRSALLSSGLLDLLVGLFCTLAVKCDRFLPGTVIHQLMPRLTCRHPEKCQESHVEGREIGMLVDGTLKFDSSEGKNAKDGVQEQEQEEQASDICELLDGSNKGGEEDSQALVLFDDLENPADSQGPCKFVKIADFKLETVC
jgi:hypothetical protein